MAISKQTLREWPWNNRPSSRHVWAQVHSPRGEHIERCKRCGSCFVARADTTAAVYCYPKAEWMAANPTDDGLLGERKTPFG